MHETASNRARRYTSRNPTTMKVVDSLRTATDNMRLCRVPVIMCATALGCAVVVFVLTFELWIPGSVLVSIAKDKVMSNDEYLAGFALLMVAGGCAGLACLCGCCYGACSADDDCCA
jgi:predicted alpha/beta hydrolase family esterase